MQPPRLVALSCTHDLADIGPILPAGYRGHPSPDQRWSRRRAKTASLAIYGHTGMWARDTLHFVYYARWQFANSAHEPGYLTRPK
ncbi:hypothetical protein IF1G_11385 [Cordyceps javanica]|uniref:Uncharacterized protein n=1 Tax=Cordyceps javanica TaxID=43265 RepID=A0A545UKF4_9HYPO|nr:hypothetical protein IF1G_11385 [Cordyceps javanica]